MDNIIVPIVCALIGSGASTAIVTAVLNKRAEEKKKETGESQGIRWLMQDRLEHVALAYLSRDTDITYDELKNWLRGHHIYHDLLGGNGDLDALKEALKESYYKKGEQ